MSKELPQPQPSEEVDLGQLFKLIGNAFIKLFQFIASIFIGVYKVVLMLVIHFYKRMVWYAAAIVIGVVLGFIVDMNSDKMYGANLFIETNFNSARQVYENVKQFHQLAYEDKDTLELAKRLNISPAEASHLKGFYLEPDLDENEMAEIVESLPNVQQRILTSATDQAQTPSFVGLQKPITINYLQDGVAQLSIKTLLSNEKDKLDALEKALAYIEDDERVEVTPKSIRIRKIHLLEHERKRADRQRDEA